MWRFSSFLLLACSATLFAHDVPMEEVIVHGRQVDLIGQSLTSSEGVVGQQEIKIRPLLRSGDILVCRMNAIRLIQAGKGLVLQFDKKPCIHEVREVNEDCHKFLQWCVEEWKKKWARRKLLATCCQNKRYTSEYSSYIWMFAHLLMLSPYNFRTPCNIKNKISDLIVLAKVVRILHTSANTRCA